MQLSTACFPTSADTLPEDDWGSNINCPAEKLACVPQGLRPCGTEPESQLTPEQLVNQMLYNVQKEFSTKIKLN